MSEQEQRVCRVGAMRRFYAVAKADGLSVSSDEQNEQRIRFALAVFLGRPVASRRDLSAGEWWEAAAGVECCILAW